MRRCNNFIESFLEWTLSRSIAPESVLFICGLFTLSSIIRRQVWIPKIDPVSGEPLLGGWDCYPHIYCIIVADAGVITKSTSIGFAEDLIDCVPSIARTPSSLTVPIIAKRLMESPDASLCMVVPEFGTALEKAGVGLYTVLTDLFDGKKKFDDETISRGVILAEAPVVNLLGATTPDWITDNVTQSILSGGFGSRTIWLHETKPRNPVLIHRKSKFKPSKPINYDQLKLDLAYDLNHIANNIQGPYIMSDACQEWVENWYQELIANDNSDKQKIKGFIQRKPAYLFKLAMLGKLAWSDELILEIKDFEWALPYIAILEDKAKSAFKDIGKNVYILSSKAIKDYVKQKTLVPREELLKVFGAEAEPNKLNELIDGLAAACYIKPEFDGSHTTYRFLSDD